MRTLNSFGVPIFKLCDELLSRRIDSSVQKCKDWEQTKRWARLQSLDAFFMFQRGPHKFLHGTYPRVTDAFTKRLLHIVLIIIRKHRGEKYAQLLLRSVDKLDIALHPSFFTFLLLLSNIHRDIGVPGSIRTQNQNSLGCDTDSNTAPNYTTFEIPDCLYSDWHNFALSGNRCNRLVTSAQPINSPYIDKSEPSDFSLNDRNLFTNLLYFSHRFSLASHFFGAFSHIGPEARRMLVIQGSAPLQLPPLSTDSHKTSALNFGLSQTPTYEEKDEGYSDTSDYLKRPTCLNDVEALQWLRNLFAGATEGISDFLLSEICPLLVDSQANFHCSSKPSVAMPPVGRGRGRYYWSNRGSCIPSKELPFLTESGPWGSLALFTAFSQRFSSLTSLPHEDVKQSGLFIATPSALLNDLEFVEGRLSFFQDLLLLRMGTQSSRFIWELPPNKEEQNCNEPLVGQFHYCHSSFDAVILGISESVLTSLIQTHLMCGTYYRRLCWFARKLIPFTPISGQVWRGPTWACFAHAVSTWLFWYEEALQHFLQQLARLTETRCSTATGRETPGLLKFHKCLRLLSDRILFMYDICMLVDANDCPLLQLSGMELLVHLASKCIHSTCNSSESITRFLFQRAYQPFLGFLESLLLDGVYKDSGDDFNVFSVSQSLTKRDVSFWTDAFRLCPVQSKISSTAGLFPMEFQQRVIRCAKTIYLLKSIDPNHYIFKARAHFPSLQLCISPDELTQQQQAFSRYVQILRRSAQHARSTRLQKMTEYVAKQQAVLKRAIDAHASHLATFKKQSSPLNLHRSRQKKPLVELDHTVQLAGEHQSFTPIAAHADDEARLNAITKTEDFGKEVISKERKELGTECDTLMRNLALHESAAEQHVKENGLLSAAFNTSGLKAEALHALRPFASTTPDGDIIVSHASLAPDPSESSASTTSISPGDALPAFGRSSAYFAISGDTKRASLCCDVDESGDPPSKLHHTFRQPSVPADQVSTLLCPDGPAVHTLVTSMATPSLDERLVSVDDSTPRVYDPVTRFRERNPHGHSSDSTIQHVLYGSGSGPACRPSTWEAQRAVRDLEEAAKFANQPDASAFYHEALELHPEACSLAFTMAFPDCDQSSFVDTLRVTRLRAPSDQPDSHDTPPLCASHAAPLTALIDCAIVRPLTSYIHLVDTALRDHLLYEHGLLEHFSCLRQVCFLEHSEFRDLLDRLFQQATGLLTEQSKLHEATFLHDLMQSAASKFFTSSNETSDFEQFPFWATDCTPLVIRASIDLVPSKRESASKWITEGVPMVPSFNHITLVYRAPWPLNILINNRAMYKYNLIFRQLMHIKFIVWSLNSVYRWLRQNRYLNVARASSLVDIHNITLWFHEMNQVLRGVEGYLTNQAIKASWSTFIARITGSLEASQQADWNAPILSNAEHVVHLDDLMKLHDTYLDNIIKCCLLDPANRELHQVFQGMLSCVHWFYKVLCSGHWISLTDSSTPGCSFRHSGWDQLHAAHQSFRQHARFLRRRVGRLLSAPGADRAQRSLSQFVFAFGLNDFYGQS